MARKKGNKKIKSMMELIDTIEDDESYSFGALWAATGVLNCISEEETPEEISEFLDELHKWATKFKGMA